MHHIMHLSDRPFQMMKAKYKTVELRLCDEKRKLVTKGDTIEFINIENHTCLSVLVEDVKKYQNFEILYQDFSKECMGYLQEETANPSDMLNYYQKEDIQKYGVLAIQVSLLSEIH
jgi:ASC-1-like (ASCH) protein